MSQTDTLEMIEKDLRIIWGDMAVFMVNKRLKDLGYTRDTISQNGLLEFINILEKKTLTAMLGPKTAKDKAKMYRKWVNK